MLEESKDNKDELALNILRELLGLFVPIPTFLLEFTTRASPPTVKRDEKRFVEEAVVEKKLVEVAEVVVEFPIFPFPRLKLVEKKLVELAVVEKREVVVAEVVVEFVNLAVEGVVEPMVVFSTAPSFTFCATNATGTAPKIFLGDISPSHDGEPPDPPISTPRYRV